MGCPADLARWPRPPVDTTPNLAREGSIAPAVLSGWPLPNYSTFSIYLGLALETGWAQSGLHATWRDGAQRCIEIPSHMVFEAELRRLAILCCMQ